MSQAPGRQRDRWLTFTGQATLFSRAKTENRITKTLTPSTTCGVFSHLDPDESILCLADSASLFELTALPLASTFACKRLLGPALVSRLQVEGVLLNILDDVFLLNLPLEAAECALD